jgi:hypothetical protein
LLVAIGSVAKHIADGFDCLLGFVSDAILIVAIIASIVSFGSAISFLIVRFFTPSCLVATPSSLASADLIE